MHYVGLAICLYVGWTSVNRLQRLSVIFLKCTWTWYKSENKFIESSPASCDHLCFPSISQCDTELYVDIEKCTLWRSTGVMMECFLPFRSFVGQWYWVLRHFFKQRRCDKSLGNTFTVKARYFQHNQIFTKTQTHKLVLKLLVVIGRMVWLRNQYQLLIYKIVQSSRFPHFQLNNTETLRIHLISK